VAEAGGVAACRTAIGGASRSADVIVPFTLSGLEAAEFALTGASGQAAGQPAVTFPLDGRADGVSGVAMNADGLGGAVVFADCALVIQPSAAQLARIACDTADSAVRLLGLTPRVALLSFSTAGSARHGLVDKVREAGELVAAERPDLALLPEVQFDAAVVPAILRAKAPGLAAGVGDAPANVFIFPDLQSANIAYKIAERIGGARAVGPILQGLRRPVNDLSRGCSVDDIVNLVAVTAVQAA